MLLKLSLIAPPTGPVIDRLGKVEQSVEGEVHLEAQFMPRDGEINGDDYDIDDGVDDPQPGAFSDELLLHPYVMRIMVILSLDQA